MISFRAQVATAALVLSLFVVGISPAHGATFSRFLSEGMTGQDVSSLQVFLKEKGFFTYPTITGFFGGITKEALARFQASVGLEAVGHVGPKTLAVLNASNPISVPSLQVLVMQLQQVLKEAGLYEGSLTGVLDQATIDAVQSVARNAAANNHHGSGGSSSDTTAPTISSISSGAPGQTTATITWSTNENADSQVEYGLTSSYTATTTLDTTQTTSHSVGLSSLSAGTTYHYRVRSTDSSGNLATSSDQTFTTSSVPDTTAPALSSISAGTPGLTTATITWTTDEAATSQVIYGTTAAYGATTTLDSSLVTSHSVPLTGLTADTTYHYKVISSDAAENQATSSDQTFLTAYTGAVATRAIIPNGHNTNNRQIMSRRWHKASVDISSLQIAVPNWYVSAGGGVGTENSGGIASTTASIEYPAGVFTQITFSGQATGTIAAGTTLISDAVSVSIPAGSTFYTRLFWQNSTHGVIFSINADTSQLLDTTRGDATIIGNSVVDQTMGGTVTTALNYAGLFPAAIIGTTNEPSVCIIGDSIGFGYKDTPDSTGDMGSIARSIGPSFGYINMSVSSDGAESWTQNHTARLPLTNYCSHIISELGVNDIFAVPLTATSLETAYNTLWGYWSGTKPVFQTTLSPKSSSSDGWTTTSGQTTADENNHRSTVNTWLRAGQAALTGTFDLANTVENSPTNSGIWKAPDYTADGTHPSPNGYQAIKTSGVIDTSLITR